MGGGKGSGSAAVRRSRSKPTRLSNKQVDAMTRSQVMTAARSAFIANEMAIDAKYGQGRFTGKPITREEASRRFDAMADGKSLTTLRNYVKKNKSLVDADALSGGSKGSTSRNARQKTERGRTRQNSRKSTKAKEIRSMRAPRDGSKNTISVGKGKLTVSKAKGTYKVNVSPSLTAYSGGRRSFVSRLWSEAKAFITDIAKLA